MLDAEAKMDIEKSHHRSSGMGAVAKISMPFTLSVQQRKCRWSGTVRARSMFLFLWKGAWCGHLITFHLIHRCRAENTPFDEGCPNARHDVVSLIMPVMDGTAPRSASRRPMQLGTKNLVGSLFLDLPNLCVFDGHCGLQKGRFMFLCL